MTEEEYYKAISSFEQASAHLEQFAGLLGNYNKQLIEAGFTRPEALKLVKEFQAVLFQQAFLNQNNGQSETFE